MKNFLKEQKHLTPRREGARKTKQLLFAILVSLRLCVKLSIFSHLRMPVLRLAQTALQLRFTGCPAHSQGGEGREVLNCRADPLPSGGDNFGSPLDPSICKEVRLIGAAGGELRNNRPFRTGLEPV